MTAEERQAAEGVSGQLEFDVIPEPTQQLDLLQLPVGRQGIATEVKG